MGYQPYSFLSNLGEVVFKTRPRSVKAKQVRPAQVLVYARRPINENVRKARRFPDSTYTAVDEIRNLLIRSVPFQ